MANKKKKSKPKVVKHKEFNALSEAEKIEKDILKKGNV